MTTFTPTERHRTRKRLAQGVAILGVSSIAVLGIGAPASAVGGQVAEGESQFLTATGLDLASPELAAAFASFAGGSESGTSFDADAYEALTERIRLLSVGDVSAPLVNDASRPDGLVSVGQADIFGTAIAATALRASAANGAIDPDTGEFSGIVSGGSTVNLGAVFDAFGVEPLTRHILSDIDLQLGTAASRAEAGAYSGATGEYALSSLQLDLTSPLLTELPGLVDVGLRGATVIAEEVLEAVAPGGVIPLPAGVVPEIPVGIGTLNVGDVELTVTAPNFNNVVAEVMSTPGGVILTSDDGIATVDLNTGAITIDLAGVLGGDAAGLPANTEVFTSANMETISAAVANALTKTTAVFGDGVFTAIAETPISISAELSFTAAPNSATPNLNNLVVATGTLTGSGSINDFANGTSVFSSSLVQAPGLPSCARPLSFGICLAPTDIVVGGAVLAVNAAVPTVLPPVFEAVAVPIVAAIDEAKAQVLAAIDPTVAEVYGKITSAFDGLMPGLAAVTVNEQFWTGDSFTIRAVGVTLLPSFPRTTGAHLGFASSTVLAIADPTLAIDETTVQAGEDLTVSGTGWNPEPPIMMMVDVSASATAGQVELVLKDADDAQVGTAVLADVDADGSIAALVEVPAGTPDGELTLYATQGEFVRTASVQVENPVVPPTPVDPSTPGGLPTTGGDPLLLLGGAALLLAVLGGAAGIAARMRRA